MQMVRRRRNILYFVLLAALVAIIFASYETFNTATPPQKPLSDLLTALDQKQVVSGTFDSGEERVDWTDNQAHVYRTFYAAGYEATLVDRFHANQLPFEVKPSAAANLWLTVVLPNVILFLVIGGFLWYVLRRYGARRPPPQC